MCLQAPLEQTVSLAVVCSDAAHLGQQEGEHHAQAGLDVLQRQILGCAAAVHPAVGGVWQDSSSVRSALQVDSLPCCRRAPCGWRCFSGRQCCKSAAQVDSQLHCSLSSRAAPRMSAPRTGAYPTMACQLHPNMPDLSIVRTKPTQAHLKRGVRPVMSANRLVMAATTESILTLRWCAPTCVQ